MADGEQHAEFIDVSRSHTDAEWRQLHHFVLTFHDDMVDALAKGIEATPVRGAMIDLLQRCLHTMLRGPHRY